MSEGQRQGTPERQPNDVWPIELDHFDEASQAVGVAGDAERLRWVGGATRTGRVPGDETELIGKCVELGPPRDRTVADVPVQQHDVGPGTHPLERHVQPVNGDGVHRLPG